MLHVQKRFIFLGVGFLTKWYSFTSTQPECLSRPCGNAFSVICGVLSTLQYLTHVLVGSSSEILPVKKKKHSTVANFGESEEERVLVWCLHDFLGTQKPYISLAQKTQQRTATWAGKCHSQKGKNVSDAYSECQTKQTTHTHIRELNKKKKNTDTIIQTFSHTFTRTVEIVNEEKQQISTQQSIIDGICCENFHKTFKRTTHIDLKQHNGLH